MGIDLGSHRPTLDQLPVNPDRTPAEAWNGMTSARAVGLGRGQLDGGQGDQFDGRLDAGAVRLSPVDDAGQEPSGMAVIEDEHYAHPLDLEATRLSDEQRWLRWAAASWSRPAGTGRFRWLSWPDGACPRRSQEALDREVRASGAPNQPPGSSPPATRTAYPPPVGDPRLSQASSREG